jgi:3-oxoacyl-[acyl-carrier protein] reductase
MTLNPFSLAGKRAVVTGGSRGIGRAVSTLLVQAGADVCIGYHSRAADAESLAEELRGLGGNVTTHASDISTASGARSLIGHAMQTLGALDILVHSAGVWPVEEVPVAELSDERWAHTMRQNVDAMFYVSRSAAKVMREGGRIVLIASTAGQRGEAMHADYGTSKGAMISFVKSMAVEVADQGITVNAVAPGWVDTEMCEIPFANGGRERIAKGIPVGRVASPEDIAFPTVALCFAGSRHITGEILNVNGGSVLCG